MGTAVVNLHEDLLNGQAHGHMTDQSGEVLAGEPRGAGKEAGLTVEHVGGRALRWMGSAGGAVLAIGLPPPAAAACRSRWSAGRLAWRERSQGWARCSSRSSQP